jgi:hypothetical protein
LGSAGKRLQWKPKFSGTYKPPATGCWKDSKSVARCPAFLSGETRAVGVATAYPRVAVVYYPGSTMFPSHARVNLRCTQLSVSKAYIGNGIIQPSKIPLKEICIRQEYLLREKRYQAWLRSCSSIGCGCR